MANENIKDFAKAVCGVAVCVALLTFPRGLSIRFVEHKQKPEPVSYYDAVQAIAKSTMFASDKRAVMEVLKRDGSAEYYKSVISIVQTHMFASDKIAMIKTLS